MRVCLEARRHLGLEPLAKVEVLGEEQEIYEQAQDSQ
jgi:hypothetical protein